MAQTCTFTDYMPITDYMPMTNWHIYKIVDLKNKARSDILGQARSDGCSDLSQIAELQNTGDNLPLCKR
jgi:hypothetical protein